MADRINVNDDTKSHPLTADWSKLSPAWQEQLVHLRDQQLNRHDLSNHTDLPPLTIHSPALTPQQEYIAGIYQNRLLERMPDRRTTLLETITPMPPRLEKESPEAYDARRRDQLEQRMLQLESEMRDHVWGPATSSAFADYLSWLQETRVPGAVSELSSMDVPLPPGIPIPVPHKENGEPIDLDQYENQIATGKLRVNLGIGATDAPPTMAQAQRIEDILSWALAADRFAQDARSQKFDSEIARTIKESGLPESWQLQPGQDKEAWRDAVVPLIDAALKAGRLVDVCDGLKLPIQLPPGTAIERTPDGRTNIKLDLPKDARLSDPRTALILPELVRWDSETDQKIEAQVKSQLAASINPLSTILWGDLPIPDTQQGPGQVRLKDGKLIGFYDPKDKLGDGETLVHANLLQFLPYASVDPKTGDIIVQQRVQAQLVPWYGYLNSFAHNVGQPFWLASNNPAQREDAPPAATGPGDIARRAMLAGGAMPADFPDQEIPGAPIIRYKPNDLVAVNTSSGLQFMLARDLPDYLVNERALHIATNTTIAAMDAGMLCAGLGEVAAALKGGELLLTAGRALAEAGARGGVQRLVVEGSQAAEYRLLLKGLSSSSLGAGGMLNNANWEETESGRNAAMIRNGLFMVGAARQLLPSLRSGYRMIRGLEPISHRFGPIPIHPPTQAELRLGELLQTAGPVSRAVRQSGEKAVGFASYAFTPGIYSTLISQLNELGADPNAVSGAIGMLQQADSKPLAAPSESATPGIPADRMSRDDIDRYRQLLVADLPSDTEGQREKAQITSIFDKLAQVMSSPSPEAREKLEAELARNIVFTPSEIVGLDLANRGNLKLNDQELHDLMDPATASPLIPQQVRDLAAQILKSKENSSVRAASELALLYVDRQTDGSNTGIVASATVEVEGHVPGVMSTDVRHPLPTYIDARTVHITIDSQLIVNDLEHRLAKHDTDAEGVAISRLLTTSGLADVHQYGSVLQNILNNRSAKPEDKMRALLDPGGIAAVAIQLQAEEAQLANMSADQRREFLAKSFGTTLTDLEQTLTNTAEHDTNTDVRAAAAANLYGIRELRYGESLIDTANAQSRNQDPALREEAPLLRNLGESVYSSALQSLIEASNLYRDSKGTGDFAQRESAVLMARLTKSPRESVEQRIDAAQALMALIGKQTGFEANADRLTIARSMAESITNASEDQALRIINTLGSGGLTLLEHSDKPSDKPLAQEVIQTALGFIHAPTKYNPTAEAQMISMFQAMSDLLKDSDPKSEFFTEAKSQFVGNAIVILRNSSSLYYSLRSAAIDALAGLGAQGALDDIEELAASDPYASVRKSAIEGLERLNDPALIRHSADPNEPRKQNLLSQLINHETDPTVLSILRDIESSNLHSGHGEQTAQDLLAFQRSIDQRYPELAHFELKGPNWFDKLPLQLRNLFVVINKADPVFNPELLDPEKFRQEVLQKTASTLGDPIKTQQIADQLAAQREHAFDQLIQLASTDDGPTLSPLQRQLALESREILFSIISGDIKIESSDESIKLGQRLVTVPGGEEGGGVISLDAEWQQKQIDWRLRAANSVATFATQGSSWRDLTADLISKALAMGVPNEESQPLLQAWSTIGAPEDGVRPIPESLQKYLAEMYSFAGT